MDIKPYYPCDTFNIESVKRPDGYDMKHLHYHKAYELYFLEEGRHGILMKDKFIQIFPQDVVLFSPNVLHKSQDTTSYSRTCIYFTEEFLREYFTDQALDTLLQCFETDVISLDKKAYFRVQKLLSKIQELYDSNAYHRIFTYLGELLDLLTAHRTDIRKEPMFYSDEKLGMITTYISENYKQITCLEEIASHFHISIAHLCRVFKKHTGMTITQYLNHVKLQHSCEMLSYTNNSITEIALDCGFNSSMYFCKTFKREIGCTPGEFRRNTT